jgi:DNA-binding transcriptional ArsR family regulator
MNAPLRQFKAELFKALAHPARIKILELLRQGEQTVSELQVKLEIDPSSVSQHLAVLRSRRLIDGRKVGTSVYYRVVDQLVFVILDAAREIFESQVEDLQGMLQAQREEDGVLAAAQVARGAESPLPASVGSRGAAE